MPNTHMSLPADLPENWELSQIVSPDGVSAGLTAQHGYNYLNKAVNDAQKAVNDAFEEIEELQGEVATSGALVRTYPAGMDLKAGDVVDVQADGTVKTNFRLNKEDPPEKQYISGMNFSVLAGTAEGGSDNCITVVGTRKTDGNITLRVGQIIDGRLYYSSVLDDTNYSSTGFGYLSIEHIVGEIYAISGTKYVNSSKNEVSIWIIEREQESFVVRDKRVLRSGSNYNTDGFVCVVPYVFVLSNTTIYAYNYKDKTVIQGSAGVSTTALTYGGFTETGGYHFISWRLSGESTTRRIYTHAFNPQSKEFTTLQGGVVVGTGTISFMAYAGAHDIIVGTSWGINLIQFNENGSFILKNLLSDGISIQYNAVNYGQNVFIFSTLYGFCKGFTTNGNKGTFSNTMVYNTGFSSPYSGAIVPFDGSFWFIRSEENDVCYIQKYMYQLIDDPMEMTIYSGVVVDSSSAIVLSNTEKGEDVEVIFSGITEMEGVPQGTVIQSPGVYGVSPIAGILSVYAKERPANVVMGEYIGTGTGGLSGAVVINTETPVNLLIITYSSIADGTNRGTILIGVRGSPVGILHEGSVSSSSAYTSDYGAGTLFLDKKVLIYTDKGSKINELGMTYKYIAFVQ